MSKIVTVDREEVVNIDTKQREGDVFVLRFAENPTLDNEQAARELAEKIEREVLLTKAR